MTPQPQEYRVPVSVALDWQLHKKSLRQALHDAAEDDLGLAEVEGEFTIVTVITPATPGTSQSPLQEFVATFNPATPS